MAAACRIASAASRSCRADCVSSGRFSSRDELLEPARRFLGLIGEIALLLAGSAARCLLAERGATPLAFGFLLLPPRELLQLLHQLVELLIGLLLRCLLARLVLIRHLVELHLEQVGEILRHRAAAPASAAALLALHLHLHLVFFFGLLEELQRLLLGRRARPPGLTACSFDSAFFISATACGRSSATFLNAGSCCDEPAVHPRDQPVDLIAQPRLRQRDHRGVLAQLVGRHLLAVALHVEGRGDDLPLLLRQRADLALPTAATAATRRASDGARLNSLLSGRTRTKYMSLIAGLDPAIASLSAAFA